MASKRRKIVAEDFDLGYGATTIPTDSGGTRAANKVGLHTWNEVINVKQYGATGNGVTDDTAAIQAAIDAVGTGTIYFPDGTYKVTSSLLVGSDIVLRGSSVRTTSILGNLTSSVIKSENTAAQGDYFDCIDLTISNTTKNNAGGVAIDLTNFSNFRGTRLRLLNAETGVKVYGASSLSSSYHNFFDCEIGGCTIGISYGADGSPNAVGNETNYFGGSISNCTTGVSIVAMISANAKFYGTNYQTLTTIFDVDATSTGLRVFGGRAESATTFLSCASDGQGILIDSVDMSGITTPVSGALTTKAIPKLVWIDSNAVVSVGTGSDYPFAQWTGSSYPRSLAPLFGAYSTAASTSNPAYTSYREAGGSNQKAWWLRDDGTLKWGFTNDNGATTNDFIWVGRGSGSAVANVTIFGTLVRHDRGTLTGGFFWDAYRVNGADKWSVLSTESAGVTQYQYALTDKDGDIRFGVLQDGGVYPGAEVTFAQLPASPPRGTQMWITDSSTVVWGATIAGGGADGVLGCYNGANWTVMAK